MWGLFDTGIWGADELSQFYNAALLDEEVEADDAEEE